ncbi:MAG: class II fructose-1,6-bisphosphate aldolase [Firmicutes bacterium]|nr:class II fructose-1,6-bisphosphate aldolase [Bacillota bacterium]
MLVSLRELLQEAKRGRYAIGAFNFSNLETLRAIILAAQRRSAPVIIQTSQTAIKYAGLEYIVAMARVAGEQAGVPVVLHLDHGTDLATIEACIKAGYSSVMIDASHHSFTENIRLTKEVVAMAHAHGVSVEAELGRLAGQEDEISVGEREAAFTDPAEARAFVEETGVDALAVAVGTAHGLYRGEPHLDFLRLQQIAELVSIPLVLHGASGVPDASIRQAIACGISKINIDTELRIAFYRAVKNFLDHHDTYDPRKFLSPAIDAMAELVEAKIDLFGSANKAVR